MANTQEKIMESIAELIPEEAQEKVSSALSAMIDELHNEYEDTYNEKLREAYDSLTAEHEENIKKAHQGYEEAYEIITDLRNRLELQKEEFDQTLEENYEEAYQMLLSERSKNENLEVQLYEEYDGRLKDIKEYMVDKIDQFLSLQGDKFYEMAKEEVLHDPCLAEHKVAFDKIVDVVGDYITDEEYMFNTSSKVDGLRGQLEKESKEKRLLEAKIMRLESDNNKLNEVARDAQKLLEEQMLNEEKEWVNRGRNAEGKGEVAQEERRVVLSEYNEEADTKNPKRSSNSNTQNTIMEQWRVLAGMNNEE